jgi:hypothetical protein
MVVMALRGRFFLCAARFEMKDTPRSAWALYVDRLRHLLTFVVERRRILTATALMGLRTDYLVELLPFDLMQSDLRPNCAVAQFAKPPTVLRNAEWGTLRGDL